MYEVEKYREGKKEGKQNFFKEKFIKGKTKAMKQRKITRFMDEVNLTRFRKISAPAGSLARKKR